MLDIHDHFRDLEKAVEDLSELLETAIEPENIPTLRQKMTDKTVRLLIVPDLLRAQLYRIGICPEAERNLVRRYREGLLGGPMALERRG